MTIAVDLGRKATKQTNKLRPIELGNGGDFDFLAAGLWYDPVLIAHLPGWGVVTNGWCAYFFRLYAVSHL